VLEISGRPHKLRMRTESDRPAHQEMAKELEESGETCPECRANRRNSETFRCASCMHSGFLSALLQETEEPPLGFSALLSLSAGRKSKGMQNDAENVLGQLERLLEFWKSLDFLQVWDSDCFDRI